MEISAEEIVRSSILDLLSDDNYIIQLLDETNTYRSKPIQGKVTELNDLVERNTQHLDLDSTTVLVIMEGNKISQLPLYSLKTFIHFIKIKANLEVKPEEQENE